MSPKLPVIYVAYWNFCAACFKELPLSYHFLVRLLHALAYIGGAEHLFVTHAVIDTTRFWSANIDANDARSQGVSEVTADQSS